MKLVNRRRIWHTLLLWVVVLLIAVMTLFVHIPEAHGQAGQTWRLQVTFGLLEETKCGPDTFDTLASCEGFKTWVAAKAAWHGQNTYECVLDSQCPSN